MMHRRSWQLAFVPAGILVAATMAFAHQDPSGCTGADIAQSLLLSKPNGVRTCEPLTASTTLTWVSNCLISGGNLTIGLADPTDLGNQAAEQTLGSVAVPCLGAAVQTAEGCMPGQANSQALNNVVVTPRPQDITAGQMVIRARWAGVLHQSVNNQAQTNFREVVVPLVPCPEDTFCEEFNCVYDPQTDSASCPGTDISATQCPDNQFCADVVCNDEIDQCVTTNTSTSQCPDNQFCADVVCNEELDQCVTTNTSASQCPDNLFCADVVCNEQLDQCVTTNTSASQCPDNLFCQNVTCNEATDQCDTTDDSDKCHQDPEIPDVCEPCNETTDMCEVDLDLDPSCMPVEAGCRITGGGITSLGETDPERLATVDRASFGGQVGAPCGCIGCFDDFDHVQGQWVHVRHRGNGRLKGPDFASLICGCDGVFDGFLCNPGDRDPGPEPRPAPANMACWTGSGKYNKRDAVFRVEVEDRGEPGAGKNAGPSEDVYRMRIWTLKGNETAEELLDEICCRNSAPTGRGPDIDDGGNLLRGNIQIHPPTPLTDRGTCPPPDGTCRE